MLKKTITYMDFDENEHVGTFYFHMNKAEFYDWVIGLPDKVREKLEKAADSETPAELKEPLTDREALDMMHHIRTLILRSYGEKSEDGLRFVKNPQMSEEFSQTDAFEKLYDELLEDPENVSTFIEGIVPKSLAKDVEDAKGQLKAQQEKKPMPVPKGNHGKGAGFTIR